MVDPKVCGVNNTINTRCLVDPREIRSKVYFGVILDPIRGYFWS